jgi:ketosteroid isomerase-like protein
MKRNLITLALPLAVALVALNLTGCQPAEGPTTNTAPPVVRETPPDVGAITTELMRIENDWPRVIKERDVEAIRKVEAEDYFGVVPDGSVSNKEMDIKDATAGNMTADSAEVTDIKVTVLDNDAAVASGRTILKGGKYKMPDGKSMDISGEYRFVDTFARRNGEWKLVASAAVRVMNPTPAASPTATPKTTPAAADAKPATKATPAAATKPSPVTKTPPPPPAPKATP